jgi:hypothetical protein
LTEHLISDLDTPTPYANAEFYPTGIDAGAGGANQSITASFHINSEFLKIYTINPLASDDPPYPNNLYHANLPWTNEQIEVLPDTNTQNARLTGIWTFPPYVYVSKLAGLTYGNQLLKFYDPDLVPPNAPIALALPGALKNYISWSSVVGATSYNIYWSLIPGVTTSDTLISGVTSPYVHMPLAFDIPVYYIVTTIDDGVESEPSNEVTATPKAFFVSAGHIIW